MSLPSGCSQSSSTYLQSAASTSGNLHATWNDHTRFHMPAEDRPSQHCSPTKVRQCLVEAFHRNRSTNCRFYRGCRVVAQLTDWMDSRVYSRVDQSRALRREPLHTLLGRSRGSGLG